MKFVPALLVAATLVAAPASAQFTTHTDRTAFNGAAGTVTTEDFETCPGGASITGTLDASNLNGCGSIAAGIIFSPDPGFDLYIAGPGQSANPTTALGVDFPTAGNNRIFLLGGATAFGADFNQNFGGGSQSGSPADFTLDVYALDNATLVNSFNFNVASGSPTFFGITSTTGFGSVFVRQAGGYAVLDNVSFGNNASGVVPEPASWAMLIAGFGLVGAVSRRRRAVAA